MLSVLIIITSSVPAFANTLPEEDPLGLAKRGSYQIEYNLNINRKLKGESDSLVLTVSWENKLDSPMCIPVFTFPVNSNNGLYFFVYSSPSGKSLHYLGRDVRKLSKGPPPVFYMIFPGAKLTGTFKFGHLYEFEEMVRNYKFEFTLHAYRCENLSYPKDVRNIDPDFYDRQKREAIYFTTGKITFRY